MAAKHLHSNPSLSSVQPPTTAAQSHLLVQAVGHGLKVDGGGRHPALGSHESVGQVTTVGQVQAHDAVVGL